MSRKAYKTTLAWSLMALAVAVVGAGFLWYSSLPKAAQLDPESLCPVDQAPAGHSLLLVDRTDPYTPDQRRRLRQTIMELARAIQVHERLSIRLITGDPEQAARPVFNLCNPGDGRLVDPLTGNPARAQKLWQDSFGAPLEAILDSLMEGASAPRSPILEAVEVALWSHDFSSDLPRRRLILFSDLLQNVPGHSHYKALLSSEAFLATPAGQRLQGHAWHNLTVDLIYLRNPQAAHRQGAVHLAFWHGLFQHLGAPPRLDRTQLAQP